MMQSANAGNTKKRNISRLVFRWIHIIFGIPILGYIYSPFDLVHYYAGITRFVFVPVLVLSGLWMWKGHWVRRLFASRTDQHDAPNHPLAAGNTSVR
jgi:hypothetical protein